MKPSMTKCASWENRKEAASTRADAIIAYREANGPFGSIEEIMNIEGIKEKMFEKIRGSIEV